jgi:hypothetical protein
MLFEYNLFINAFYVEMLLPVVYFLCVSQDSEIRSWAQSVALRIGQIDDLESFGGSLQPVLEECERILSRNLFLSVDSSEEYCHPI